MRSENSKAKKILGHRILLLGCSGAGKSTLATKLAKRFALPLHFIDQLIWKQAWVMVSDEELERSVQKLLRRKVWVVDGMLGRHTARAAARAETVVFLDFPRWICIWSVLKRVSLSYGRARPEMHPGCPEQFDWEFLVWIWNWRRNNRPKVLKALQSLGPRQKLVHLKSRGELARWLQTF